MEKQENRLIQKIDGFIRKYYQNRLLKGIIYSLTMLLGFFLIFNYIEFFGNLNSSLRTFLFYLYITGALFIIIRFIIIPILKLFRFGNIISYKQAAIIIGSHFPEVSDKLLNLLQLEELKDNSTHNIDLVIAGIEQKTKELQPIPFKNAIEIGKNKKYLKYLVIPVLIIGGILITAPKSITDPTTRLVKHNKHFEKPLPYSVKLISEKLEAMQYDDFNLMIKVFGEEIPDAFYIVIDNNKVKMVKDNAVTFYHNFIRLQKDQRFYLTAGEYKSETYKLTVFPKPMILDFDVFLQYPPYTQKKNESLSNNGDLIVPMGTIVNWTFYTKNTDKVSVYFPDDTLIVSQDNSNSFIFKKKLRNSQVYSVKTQNEFLSNPDSLNYNISIIPDLFPSIEVEETMDTLQVDYIFFRGMIKDDYGFRKLEFNHRVLDEDKNLFKKNTIPLANQNPQQFYYSFDLSLIKLVPGDELEYYFTIWDNDGVNGSKSSSTRKMYYRLPSLQEIEKESEQKNDEIKDDLQDAMDELISLRKEIEDVNKKLLEENELNWEDNQQINELFQKQTSLKNKISELQKKNTQKQLNETRFKEMDPALLEKQQQLNDLFEELMKDEELNKIFEEMQKLMEEANKEKLSEMLKQLEEENFDMENALDRNLELFKQLEFEIKLDETIKKLDDLAKEQNELSEETKNKSSDLDDVKEKQEDLNEKFDAIKEDLEKLEELNNDMEESNEFSPMEEQQEEVEQQQEESMKSLDEKKKKKASKSQKNAGDKIQEMADDLLQMQQDMIGSGMEEDMDALREILENLIQLSFDQESLMKEVSVINNNDPGYTDLSRDQKKIIDDMKMVSDSLFALSKRQIMIEPFVQEQVNSIHSNLNTSLDLLEQRKTANASSRQQLAMTSMNNLALMLSETLEQMKMAANSNSNGQSSCKNGKPKPGGKGGKMSKMKNLQQQLNKQLGQMKDGMKDGMKKGQKEGGQSQGMSEKLARMAAEQEAIRNQMQQYADQLEKEGDYGTSGELKRLMEEMEKTETDLVNKVLTNETLIRQQEILNELLKSEQAELEREKDEKRESNEAKNQKISNPLEKLEYKKQRLNEVELLKTIPPSLNPFYKKKVNEYFYNFDKQ